MCLKSFLLFLQTFSLFAQNPIQQEIDSMFYRYLNFSEYVKGVVIVFGTSMSCLITKPLSKWIRFEMRSILFLISNV